MNKIPVLATPAKRPAPKEEEGAEETFLVKKKKGVIGSLRAPAAPSLRRSTVASTELSKLAAMVAPPKRSVSRRANVRATGKNNAKTGIRNLNTTTTFGTNRLNTTVSSNDLPSYMRSTTSATRKGGLSKLPKGGRKTVKSSEEPLKENTIPKIASSTGKVMKKKRPAWDVKGRLEDVTCLYNEIKEEKRELTEKVTKLEELTADSRTIHDQLTERAEKSEKLYTETNEELGNVTNERNTLQIELKLTQQKYSEKCSYSLNLDRQVAHLEEQLADHKQTISKEEATINELESTLLEDRRNKNEVDQMLEKREFEIAELGQKIADLETQVADHKKTILKGEAIISELERTIKEDRKDKTDVDTLLERREDKISRLEQKIADFEKEIADHKRTISKGDATIYELERTLKEERKDKTDVDTLLEKREDEISELEQKLAEYMEKMRTGENNRRKLHNTIQELKGNIRVYCRVRPFLAHEITEGECPTDIPQIEFSKDSCTLVVKLKANEKLGRKAEINNSDFTFDHVFSPHHGQTEAFEEVAGLVQSALDGYNVCIFAYGQTGSGKTHTMEGPDSVGEDRGMIPRAMEQIFETATELEIQGWTYIFTASIIEIYNETLHDLLSNNSSEKIEIKLVNDKTRDVEVTNVKCVEVKESKHVQTLLEKASKNRSVAATKCNERSSRSHSVFRLKIEGYNHKNGDACVGNLNLVDLAGSERVAHSGSTGQRLKEAQAINTSLSELGNVIMALNEKKSHVPYRNSKLTYLLCNSLGGNSKTLMFVNVSPLDKHTQESINSLRFASKVNRCNIGTAKKNG